MGDKPTGKLGATLSLNPKLRDKPTEKWGANSSSNLKLGDNPAEEWGKTAYSKPELVDCASGEVLRGGYDAFGVTNGYKNSTCNRRLQLKIGLGYDIIFYMSDSVKMRPF